MQPDLLAGRYELTERLAGGGMGQVWKARDRTLERIVAIKTVDLSSPEATLSERFRREAVATAGLNHANIVHVYDAGTDGSVAFLVMELLSGPSLHQLIREQGPLSIEEGLRLAREVTRGLLAAHAIGVVHRDIKPGNVMYDHDRIKLVDFGIAQLSERMGATLTAPATALGTAAYMSPEQATGTGATQASDWYALGCLLTTVFTGEPPFRGDAVHVATQQVDTRPPRLSERRPDVPPALDDLVDRLLAKAPADRPSGHEVLDQVRALEIDPNAATMLMAATRPSPTGAATAVLPVTPTEPPLAPPPARLAELDEDDRRRSPWPFVLVGLFVLAALVAAAYWGFGRQLPPVSPPSAIPVPAPSAVPPTNRPPATTKPTQAPMTGRSSAPPRSSAPASSAPAPSAPAPSASVTTSPVTTAAPTRSSTTPAPARSPGTGDPLRQAIARVANAEARAEIARVAPTNRGKGQLKEFARTVDRLQKTGSLTDEEAERIREASELED